MTLNPCLRGMVHRAKRKIPVSHSSHFFFFNQGTAALQYYVSFWHTLKWISYIICRDVDGPRESHTEWSKLEREKQTSCINAYIWNLEKWFRWTYLQGRKRNTDGENRCMDAGESRGGWTLGLAHNLTPDLSSDQLAWGSPPPSIEMNICHSWLSWDYSGRILITSSLLVSPTKEDPPWPPTFLHI